MSNNAMDKGERVINEDEIPVIENEEDGYWEIYPDRKIWHDCKNMSFKNQEEIEKKYNVGGGWLTLKEGENKIRIVSDCFDYGNHFLDGKSTICVGKENCAFCKKGLKPSVQFLSWAIDRTDGHLELFRFGYTIYKQIVAYKNNEEYSFESIPDYDFTVNRVGTGKQSEYTVVPARKNTKLSEAEKEDIEENANDINEIIDKMKAKVSKNEIEDDGETIEEDIDPKKVPF